MMKKYLLVLTRTTKYLRKYLFSYKIALK